MSHFAVLVIGNDPEGQLKPYNENDSVPRYVKYTKAQLIAKSKKEIAETKKRCYLPFKKDPEKYKKECNNPRHITYLENEFPKMLKWTDKQHYANQIQYYQKEEIGKKGEVYSTYNPNSKWDWYQLGGRWTGYFKVKEPTKAVKGNPGLMTDAAPEGTADQARKKDIVGTVEATFAVVKDGKWYEKGEMGWWGMTRNEKSDKAWEGQFKKLIDKLPDDTLLSLYDLHI